MPFKKLYMSQRKNNNYTFWAKNQSEHKELDSHILSQALFIGLFENSFILYEIAYILCKILFVLGISILAMYDKVIYHCWVEEAKVVKESLKKK